MGRDDKRAGFTKQMARDIFWGGTLFFALVLAAIIFDTEQRIPARSNAQNTTPAVIAGKKIWETRNCIGSHTLLGESAYFALGPCSHSTRGSRAGRALVLGLPCLLMGALWAVTLLSYLLPPAEIWGNLLSGRATPNQARFLAIATLIFTAEFAFARHLFCHFGCAKAWPGWPIPRAWCGGA